MNTGNLMAFPLCALTISVLSSIITCGQALQARQIRRHEKFIQLMSNQFDTEYLSNITVGGQVLQGILDTGSTELVVLSAACGILCGDVEHLYDESQSLEYVAGSYRKVLSYGSGDLLGDEAYDRVSVGPFGHSPTAFWKGVDAVMPILWTSKLQAIIGLGPIPEGIVPFQPGSATNKDGKAVLLTYLGLNESRYSACLGRVSGSPGYLVWNDDSVSTNPTAFTRLSVKGSGYWMTNLQDLRLGDTTVACKDGCAGLLDTGTSLIAVPPSVKSSMALLVESLKADCSTDLRGLPFLKFRLDGQEFALPPDAYLGALSGNVSSEMKSFVGSSQISGSTCELSVMTVSPSSSLGPMIILGMPFFRTYYSTFAQRTSSTPHQMFIARANHDCTPATSSTVEAISTENKMRHIDASKVRISPWLAKAHARGHLNEMQGGTNELISATENSLSH